MKVLIANIFGIGDVLNTTPLIANIKKAYEDDVSVDYLCNARVLPIIENVPGIDSIFVYEKDDFVKVWNASKIEWLKKVYDLFSAVQKQKYDIVFDFTLSRRFGFFFTLAGIPKRAGLDYKKRGFFLTSKVPLTAFDSRHIIEYYLDALRCLDIAVSEKTMRLRPDEESVVWISNYLKNKGIEEGTLITVVPGGGASWGREAYRRRWKAENFSFVADALGEAGFKIAVVGDKSETELCRKVASAMRRAPSLVENSLSLKQYTALLKKSSLVLCNDGGPLHITVALGTKGVFVFGPVDATVYGPYPVTDKHKVVSASGVSCRPCYYKFKLPECNNDKRCLSEISPEQVAKECLKLVKED